MARSKGADVGDCKHCPELQAEVEWLAVSRMEMLLNALQKFYGVLPPPPRDPFT
jgi:hypothetical protein